MRRMAQKAFCEVNAVQAMQSKPFRRPCPAGQGYGRSSSLGTMSLCTGFQE